MGGKYDEQAREAATQEVRDGIRERLREVLTERDRLTNQLTGAVEGRDRWQKIAQENHDEAQAYAESNKELMREVEQLRMDLQIANNSREYLRRRMEQATEEAATYRAAMVRATKELFVVAEPRRREVDG